MFSRAERSQNSKKSRGASRFMSEISENLGQMQGSLGVSITQRSVANSNAYRKHGGKRVGWAGI